ncbi:hypothetical protein MN086_08450 [Sulfurovum sp. XGS-02]|uniref:hypothetical protein n=1 Tax=Sulfurovum sp. XGS-02 TaxID=2925411 RepID=UPI0020611AB1|nr:hypothetical protein [Sulfurovum sp. XGS-02]UPT77078.1 hypothetical protein MN086_08450 [Sulfurovum sp. XGS-02]
MADKLCTVASSGIYRCSFDSEETFVQMKNTALYNIPIIYMVIYVILILVSGLWLFLLSQGLECNESVFSTLKSVVITPAEKSVEGLIEVATPHMFAIGTLIFVVAHFMLFSTNFSQKISLIVAMALFVFALFDIFSYFAVAFGLVVSGWIKLAALSGFVLLFLLMLGLVGFSL